MEYDEQYKDESAQIYGVAADIWRVLVFGAVAVLVLLGLAAGWSA